MTYHETLSYLFARLPMYSRIGAAAYKADLDNTIALLKVCGNPHHKFKSIHIAGTNGKGSVSHMLAAILQTAGYKTGLYTSPHLKDFRERIRINGEMISEEKVVEFTTSVQPTIEEINPSFFEVTVAMAFSIFAEENVDIAIIETGLGGRLDSTNVITPLLSVITNIGWDHMNLLGDSLEKIAGEKAGIIKPGIPVIVGETLPETAHVFESTAVKNGASLFYPTSNKSAISWYWEKEKLVVEVALAHSPDHIFYHLDLMGIYQARNLLTVLEAVSLLQSMNWNISKEDVTYALGHVKKLTGLRGRWDIISRNPDIVIDVAHNEAGVRSLLEQVEITDHNNLHIIIGLVADKEADRILSLLPHTATYYFTQAQIPRALPFPELQQKAAAAGLRGQGHPEVNDAIAAAVAHASHDDLVLVCGSVFLAGEVNYQ